MIPLFSLLERKNSLLLFPVNPVGPPFPCHAPLVSLSACPLDPVSSPAVSGSRQLLGSLAGTQGKLCWDQRGARERGASRGLMLWTPHVTPHKQVTNWCQPGLELEYLLSQPSPNWNRMKNMQWLDSLLTEHWALN